jgi:nucleotide-binding universal stress UspA family protein
MATEIQDFCPTGVVVGDDGSAGADHAVAFAAQEAARRGCTLHVVRAYTAQTAPRPSDLPFGYVASQAELEDATLSHLRSRWLDLGVPTELHAVRGAAAKTLLAASRTADVVVVGARGHGGFDRLLVGSVADQVVHHAHCPVIVVKR